MNKEQKIKRKIERRLKNKSKHITIQIESLRKEIHANQFPCVNQPLWNRSCSTTIEQIQ